MKFQSMPGQKRAKYGAKWTRTDDGINHASRKQARRWDELKLLERAGEIEGLRREVTFPLIVNGIVVTTYRADHVYREKGKDADTVEDVKGVRTEAYSIKARLMRACHGIEVREV